MNQAEGTNLNVRLGCQEGSDMVKDNGSRLITNTTCEGIGMTKNDCEMISSYQEVCSPTLLTVSSWDSSSFGDEEIDDFSLLSQCPSLLFDDDVKCECETTALMIEDNENMDFLLSTNESKEEKAKANNEGVGANPQIISDNALDTARKDGGTRPLMSSMEMHQENDCFQLKSSDRFEPDQSKIFPIELRGSTPSGSPSSSFCLPKEFCCTDSIYARSCLGYITGQPSRSSLERSASIFLCMPDDMIFSITSFLDIGSLLKLRSCNRRMSLVASRDEAGWQSRCVELWSTKINVCPKARSLIEQKTNECFNAMEAYKLSLLDASIRNEILTEELCYDPSSNQNIVWSFRFKESAGPDWTSWDPWWNGREAKRMVFLKDGSVMELSHSCSLKSQVQHQQSQPREEPFLGQANFALRNVNSSDSGQTSSTESRIKIKWRFIDQPMDLPPRPHGSYIRLTIGGRDVPTYVVRRSPTGNWGFILESCWGVYASFALPKRTSYTVSDIVARENYRVTATRNNVALNRRTRMRIRRTNSGARWVNVEGIESDESDYEEDNYNSHMPMEGHSAFSERMLIDDKYMTVTNFSQWREALLYNHGARSLPHGKGATEEFDRAWRSAVTIQTRNDSHIIDTGE